MTQTIENLPENTYEADAALLLSAEGGSYVYFLTHAGVVIYVGQSTSLFGRIGSHTKTMKFDAVRVMYVPHCMRLRVEAELIVLLRPRHNNSFRRMAILGEKPLFGTMASAPALCRTIVRRKIISLVEVDVLEIRWTRAWRGPKGRCSICDGPVGENFARVFIREDGHHLTVMACEKCGKKTEDAPNAPS
jgi:hypothetical protein